MNKNTLGVILIGQSPRPDIVTQLRAVLGPELGIEVRGALDGVPKAEIDTFTPKGSDDTLFTRLPGGEEVIISKKEVTKRVQTHIDHFADRGIDITLMFCTGAFKGLTPRGHMIFPSAILTGVVEALLPKGRLGIFTPLPTQIEQAKSKWIQGQWEVLVEPLLPVESTLDLAPPAKRMATHKPDLIVMDCMGYTPLMKKRIYEITGIPSILAVSAAARMVQELMA
jgi:protein AroM